MLLRATGRAVYAASLTAGFAVALAGLASIRAEMSLPCVPSARLTGEPGLVLQLQALLVRRGIVARASSDAIPGCAPLTVHVRSTSPAGPGVHLLISDAEGRTTHWHLARTQTAAMLIESWARTDLAASLSPPLSRLVRWSALPDSSLDQRPGETGLAEQASVLESVGGVEPVTAPVPGSATTDLAAFQETAPVLAPVATGRPSLSTTVDSGVDRSRSFWLGGGLGLCLQLGPVCTGAAARFAASANLRRGEALATVELPLPLAGFRLVPNVGLGVARLRGEADSVVQSARRRSGDRRHGGDDPGNHHDAAEDHRSGESTADDGGSRTAQASATTGRGSERWITNALRAYAGLALFRPIASTLALELAVSYGTAVARTDPNTRSGSSWADGELGLRLGLRYGPP